MEPSAAPASPLAESVPGKAAPAAGPLAESVPGKAARRKCSAFVFLYCLARKNVYMVCNHRGEYGAPGGQGEPCEHDDPFTTAAREFQEETGREMPFVSWEGGRAVSSCYYEYLVYGDRHHSCYFFFKGVGAETVDLLPGGESPDPCRAEHSVGWVEPHRVWGKLRSHIRCGLKLLAARDPRFEQAVLWRMWPRAAKNA